MAMGNVLVLACGNQTSAPFLHVLEITILHSGFPLNKETKLSPIFSAVVAISH